MKTYKDWPRNEQEFEKLSYDELLEIAKSSGYDYEFDSEEELYDLFFESLCPYHAFNPPQGLVCTCGEYEGTPIEKKIILTSGIGDEKQTREFDIMRSVAEIEKEIKREFEPGKLLTLNLKDLDEWVERNQEWLDDPFDFDDIDTFYINSLLYFQRVIE